MANDYDKNAMRKEDTELNPNSINYLIFSQRTNTFIDISLDESFILEGLLLGLCLKGSAKIKVNFNEYELKRGSILFLLPNQIVKLVDKSDDFLLESLYISFDFILDLPLPTDFESVYNIRKRPCLMVPQPVIHNLMEYYSFIVKQYNKENQTYRDTIIKGLLFALVTEYLAAYKFNTTDDNKQISTRQEELTNSFFKYLMLHYKEDRSVAFYADKLCITRKHLSSTVKQVTGRSVLEWIHIVFISSVKVQLKNSSKTILELSEEFNCPSPSFFCRFFKEQTGMSPMEYRKA